MSPSVLRLLLGIVSLFLLVACQTSDNRPLSKKEQQWLSDNKKIDVLFGYEAPPNAFYNDKGQYTGLLIDFLKEIEGHLDTKFIFKKFSTWKKLIEYSETGRNFVIVGIAHTDSRAKFLSFTGPFIKIPYVIVTRQKQTITVIDELIGKRVCTVSSYAINDYIKLHYPQIVLSGVSDNLEGLQAVSTGSCDAMVINQMYATYLIEQQGITNLTIATESGYQNKLSAAASIHDPILFNIIDKTVDNISKARQQEIYLKWLAMKDSGLSQATLLFMGITALILLSLLILSWLWTVSLRKQADKRFSQLIESRKQFEVTIKEIPIPVMVFDSQDKIVFINDKLTEMSGYTLTDLNTLNAWWLAVCPDEIERNAMIMEWGKVGKQPEKKEINKSQPWKIVTKNGMVRWVEQQRTKLDEITVVAMNDVTQQKRLYDKLLESQERFKTAAELTSDLIYEWNMNSNELIWFGDIDKALGYETGAFPHTMETWEKRLHPDEYERLRQSMLQHIKQGTPFKEEYKIQCKDGSYRTWIDTGMALLDDNGETCRWIGIVVDLTDRKKTEQHLKERDAHLRTLIDTLNDLIWLKDSDGLYLLCNHKFERFFGAKEAEIIGKTDYDFLDRDLADLFRQKDKVALEAKAPSVNEEKVTYADDGHTEILETIKTPIYDSDKHLIGILGIARDITERKQNEKKFKKQLGELNRWHELMLNRETRVLEMKQEVNQLLDELNRPARYDEHQ